MSERFAVMGAGEVNLTASLLAERLGARRTVVRLAVAEHATTHREVAMPPGSWVVAFFRSDKLLIPSGDDRAHPGDDALILCESGAIDRAPVRGLAASGSVPKGVGCPSARPGRRRRATGPRTRTAPGRA
jgi:Trk K+ transport system NAD-binding subunit